MVKELKTTKLFFGVLFIKCFHNHKLLLFHVYQLHTLIYGLNFIWEFKKLEIKNMYIPNLNGPLKNPWLQLWKFITRSYLINLFPNKNLKIE
jgi:hypothetical protein